MYDILYVQRTSILLSELIREIEIGLNPPVVTELSEEKVNQEFRDNKLKEVDVPGDGHCFFHAFRKTLGTTDACDIETYRVNLIPIKDMEDTVNQDILSYEEMLRQIYTNAWANSITIQKSMEDKGICIIIYEKKDGKWNRLHLGVSKCIEGNTIYMLNSENVHFKALVRKP